MDESTAETLAREFAALNTATERAHQVLADMRAERKLLASLLIDVEISLGMDADAKAKGYESIPELIARAKRMVTQ